MIEQVTKWKFYTISQVMLQMSAWPQVIGAGKQVHTAEKPNRCTVHKKNNKILTMTDNLVYLHSVVDLL